MKTKTKKSELRKELKDRFIKNATKSPLTEEEFKMYVTQVYALDDFRTKIKNQRRAVVVNSYIKYDEQFPEIQRLRRIENSSEGTKLKIAKLIKEALVRELNIRFEAAGVETRVDIKNVENYVNDIAQQQYDADIFAQFYEVAEADRIKDIEKYMEANLPVYDWCKDVKGLGTKLAAKLLSGIGDIRRFPNPASLWSYCGVGDAEKSTRKTGQQLSHSPKMRSTLYNLQESFIKAGSQYRVVYDKRKERTLTTHPEWHNLVPCPVKNVGKDAPKTDENGNVTWANKHPKHAHVDACRVMIKRFLAELFVAWYQSLGIEPPAKPYGVEIQGHHEDPMIVPYVGKRHLVEFTVTEDE